MELTLNIKIPIVIKEGDSIKEQFDIYFREYTLSEQKDVEKKVRAYGDILKRYQKLDREKNNLLKKCDLSEKLGDFKKSLKYIEQIEKIEKDIDKLQDELIALGGENFDEELARDAFEKLISGEGKSKLKEYAEVKGYSTIMALIRAEKEEAEKKQLSKSQNV